MNVRTRFACACLLLVPAVVLIRRSADAQSAAPVRAVPAHTTWSDYGGGADASQYSALTQINRTNVSTLRVAWTYPTGDAANYLFNPIVVDEAMYVLAKDNAIVCLDAATGRQIWVH